MKKKIWIIVSAILVILVLIGVIFMIGSKATLQITAPTEVVCSYNDIANSYISSLEESVNVSAYAVPMEDSATDVIISWEFDGNATEYLVEYAPNSGYANAIQVVTTDKQIAVRNLYKATKYYLRVTAYDGEKVIGMDESTFETAKEGPRVMSVDGLYNVRDVGGYETESGKWIKQGLIYRGCEMNGDHDLALTGAGDKVMSTELKIALDLDLRSPEEANGATRSPISSAEIVYIPLGGYLGAFEEYREEYRKVFATLAAEENYPIYIHCWGGADRTGTVCFLLGALLGMSETELIQDYEFTTFSIFGERNYHGVVYDFKPFVDRLKTYPGNTLSEKTENYLLSIGVTKEEIDDIRQIMLA